MFDTRTIIVESYSNYEDIMLSKTQATKQSDTAFASATKTFEKAIDKRLKQGKREFKLRTNSVVESSALKELLDEYRKTWTIAVFVEGKKAEVEKTGWYELAFS